MSAADLDPGVLRRAKSYHNGCGYWDGTRSHDPAFETCPRLDEHIAEASAPGAPEPLWWIRAGGKPAHPSQHQENPQ